MNMELDAIALEILKRINEIIANQLVSSEDIQIPTLSIF